MTETAVNVDPATSTVFTLDNISDPRSISAFTTDPTKALTYTFRVKVFYTDYPDNPGAFKDFTIQVTDTCEDSPTITASTLGP